MSFLNTIEKKKNKIFLDKGYIISKVENISSLKYISSLIIKATNQQLREQKIKDLNKIHTKISIEKLKIC